MNELERIREHYQNHSDEKIELIALNDSKGIKERTIPILIEEIEKRNLDLRLIDWIKAVRRELSKNEFDNLVRKIKNSTCTLCSSERKLFGFKFTTRVSAIVIGSTTEDQLIVCRACGGRRKRNSLLLTFFLGWWSGYGFLVTPFILLGKIRAAFTQEKDSKQVIEEFIHSNIGEITLGEETAEIIQELINKHNKGE